MAVVSQCPVGVAPTQLEKEADEESGGRKCGNGEEAGSLRLRRRRMRGSSNDELSWRK